MKIILGTARRPRPGSRSEGYKEISVDDSVDVEFECQLADEVYKTFDFDVIKWKDGTYIKRHWNKHRAIFIKAHMLTLGDDGQTFAQTC
jgi:hypothetical protein